MKAILWDIDGTLLNFLKSEEYGIRACFQKFGLGECTDAMMERYSRINRKWWEKLERGEITKQEVLEGRFREFFALEGIGFQQIREFNDAYQFHLGDKAFFHAGGEETVKALHGRFLQYAVTNGTALAQERKLQKSGLDQLLDGIFISEKLGFEKPDIRFFEAVFAAIPAKPEECVIIGDSLTSDMQGGINAGIAHWWYNPAGAEPDRPVDRIIAHLSEVTTWLK
ncbi:MAG: YjjG family noncanonical pyrimidine nucleotidase [Clostridia bacterium]|nr:YjjG family noncanonical pyrimidine nucleotidase [Clostridia bacterium]